MYYLVVHAELTQKSVWFLQITTNRELKTEVLKLIKEIESLKYLGVITVNYLKFRPHADYICNKLGVLSRINQNSIKV